MHQPFFAINQNLYYYQNNSCAPEGVIGAHYMRFKPPFCRRIEGREFCAFQRGTPSLAGRPLFQNSPPDCFEIHPLRSARCKGISLSAESDEGAALDPQARPPDCFEIHPLRSARCRGISLSAESDEGAALDPPAFFTRKGWAKNLSCLWQALIGRSDPQTLICRNNKKPMKA